MTLPRFWGDKFDGFMAEAKAEIEKAEDELAAARRRLTRLESERFGYESLAPKLPTWEMGELVTERDRLGASRDAGRNEMGRYLALLDEITKRGGGNEN